MTAVGAPQPNKTPPPVVVPQKTGPTTGPDETKTGKATPAQEEQRATGTGSFAGDSTYVSVSDPFIEMLAIQFLQTRLDMIEKLAAQFEPTQEEIDAEEKYQVKKDLNAKAAKIYDLCQQTKAAISGLIASAGSSNKAAAAGDLQRIATLVASLTAEVSGLQGDMQKMDTETFTQLEASNYKDILSAANQIKGILDDVGGVVERKATKHIDIQG